MRPDSQDFTICPININISRSNVANKNGQESAITVSVNLASIGAMLWVN